MKRYLRIISCVVLLSGCALFRSPSPIQVIYTKLKQRQEAEAAGLKFQTDKLNQELVELANSHKDLLISLAGDKDPSTRWVAIAALMYIRQKDVIPVVVAALDDPVPQIRKTAAGTLGILGLPDTPIQPLQFLLHDKDPDVKSASAFALSRVLREGQKVPEELRKCLLYYLKDQDPDLRNHCLLCLFKVESKEVLMPIILDRLLNDPFPPVRENAALILGRYKDPGANVYLIELLKDEKHSVVVAAAHALKEINGEDLGRHYSRWREWWEERQKPQQGSQNGGKPGGDKKDAK